MGKITERIWAAGFFDGEGCTTFSEKTDGRRQISMIISQNNKDTLDRFRRAVGLGAIYGPYDRSSSDLSSNPKYIWNLASFPKILDVLCQLIPSLSEEKRLQALSAIEKYVSWESPCISGKCKCIGAHRGPKSMRRGRDD